MAGIVEVKNLSKTFYNKDSEVNALKDINLSIEKGDIYGIIGMSGAGKSTLVRCLNFLERPTSGEVYIDGEALSGLSDKKLKEIRGSIAMIFQNFNLLNQVNIIDNVAFPLRIQKMNKAQARQKARELLKTVGLSEKEKNYPSQLSGGQKQRVAIARALANDPKILLCDEATSALDPRTTAQILELLKKINDEMGITIIVITHQMSVVQDICHKVAIIEDGRLAESGIVSDIFANPKSHAGKMLVIGEKDMEIPLLHEDRRIRIVFETNSSYEPVIANMVLHFKTPVNILRANTRNVEGTAMGDMILGLPEDKRMQEDMIAYLEEKKLVVSEVTEDV